MNLSTTNNVNNTDQVYLIQWNINGVVKHLENLQLLISKHEPILLCLQETNFTDSKMYNLKNYSLQATNRPQLGRACGGVAIYVSNKVQFTEIQLRTNIEATAISMQYPQKISVCNLYIPPNSDISEEDIQHLLEQIPHPRLIVGDFNAHNALWGSEKINKMGKLIEKIMNQQELVLLNNGDKTRFNSFSGNFSSIDLSLADPQISHVLNWEVSQDLYGSDHHPIFINNLKLNHNIYSRTQWNFKRADWTLFKSIFESSPQLTDTSNIDTTVTELKNSILNAAEISIGKTSTPKTKNPVPWWSPVCAEAIRQKKKAFNTLKRNNTQENLLSFKKVRAHARYVMKTAKKESWIKFVQMINNTTTTSQVWQNIRKIKGLGSHTAITQLITENINTTNQKEISEILANIFLKNSSNENFNHQFIETKVLAEREQIQITDQENCINDQFTFLELTDALKTCKNTCPGPDDIPFNFLKNLPNSGLLQLLEVYNKIWTKRVFPTAWTEAIIIPVHKQNKPKTDPESYRPIALTCTMSKLFEKMVNKRLTWSLEYNKLLAPEQSGFRQGRSTIDNLLELESYVNEGFANNQKCLAVFFDIKRAYDTVWRHRILQILISWNYNGNLLAYVHNFLRSRHFRVRINNQLSEQKTLKNGIPQGSIISVTLFLIAINNILENIKSPVKARLYADDLIIYIRGRDKITLYTQIQSTITRLEKWSEETGFNFAPQKTKSIFFSKRNDILPDTLHLDNIEIEYVKELMFLGMMVDDKMTWKSHIKHLKTKCQKSINIMRMLTRQNWGSDRSTLLMLYRSLIRSKLDYGAIVYASAKNNVLQQLAPIHNTALRIASGAYHTSPINSIYAETGEPSLNFRRIQQSLAYATNVVTRENHISRHNTISNRFQQVYQSRPRLNIPFYERVNRAMVALSLPILPTLFNIDSVNQNPPWKIKSPTCITKLSQFDKSQTPHALIQTHLKEILNQYTNYTLIYTDASKSDLGVGAAFVTSNNEYLYSLPKLTTVFSGELYAILQALKYIKSQQTKTVILTDSLSAVQGLKHLYTNNPLLLQIRQELYILQQHNIEIVVIWIPSHIGIAGNELADQAAARAVHSNLSQVEVEITGADLKTHLHTLTTQMWQREWDERTTKLNEVKLTVQPSPNTNLTRKEEVIITRLRIGHTRYTHEYLLNKSEKPRCQMCQCPMTVRHFLIECPLYNLQRHQCQIPDNLIEILDENVNVPNLKKYLTTINLYHKL